MNLGVRKEDEASQMTLMIGSRDSDVEQSRQYIPSVLDKGLRDWLSASLKEGELIEGGFLYHGSLRSGEDDKRSIAAFFNVDKARLQFDPEWPALDSLAGMIHIDNHNVEGHIIDGFLYGTRLSSAAINVAREAGHLRLDLNAVAKGDAADGMKILKETPLASLTAEVTGDWQGKGSADYRLALNLPLTDKDPKAEKVDFSAHLHDADLFIPSLDIKFSEVSGNLNFISGRGLSSKNLTANLWGERFHIVAGDFGENMQFQSDQNVSVKLSGRVNAETLTQWTELPALSFLRGVTEAEIHLSVIDGDVSLTAESDLVGVQVELPDRYFKSAEQVQMTRLQWPLDDGPQDMRIEIDNKAYMQFLLENEQLLGGSIYLGGSDQSSSVELGKLTVSGAVDVFTLDAWDAALDRYIEAEQRLGGGQSADVPLSAEGVEIERLYAFGEQFDQSVISAHALAGYWHISIENQMLQGVISVPESDDPAVRYRASMQYLRLPGRDLNDSSTVQAETFWSLPDAWVPIDVTIDQLYMADEPY
ncbi:hypothetical protein GYB62_03285, partial [bacterium]|nr:hypothetical protein [bacterium]